MNNINQCIKLVINALGIFALCWHFRAVCRFRL